MAQITLNIADEHLEHIAKYRSYQDKIEAGDGELTDNTETHLEFIERFLVGDLKNCVRRQRADVEAKTTSETMLKLLLDDINVR